MRVKTRHLFIFVKDIILKRHDWQDDDLLVFVFSPETHTHMCFVFVDIYICYKFKHQFVYWSRRWKNKLYSSWWWVFLWVVNFLQTRLLFALIACLERRGFWLLSGFVWFSFGHQKEALAKKGKAFEKRTKLESLHHLLPQLLHNRH